ncbi:MAG TPA: DUF4136 domain-containing protein [Povalibacter sp.]|nr:DUF4136 domain-containing protein [Povalibacter sp.]
MQASRLSLSALASFVLAVVLLGCQSSGPAVRVDGDPSANMASYKTFAFFDQVSTDKVGYGTIMSTRLKDATRRELEKRGYQYAPTGAQLLINFNVNLKDQADVQSQPGLGMGGYYGYRAGMYGVWGGYPQDIETVHYQIGTLTIDMVDAGKRQLVWQGTAQGRVSKELLQNPGASVDQVVTDIFARYPVPAPGAPAA